MDILGRLWWVASMFVTGVPSLIWFLICGWVLTLFQIALLVIVINILKYGCKLQKTGSESELGRSQAFSSAEAGHATQMRLAPRGADSGRRRVKEFGDVNISKLPPPLVLAGPIFVVRI
jgi:hypothetical protein